VRGRRGPGHRSRGEKGTEPVGNAIRDTLDTLGGESSATAHVERVWPAAVGPANARNAWPARLARDGTLHVATRDSTWAFQLGMLQTDILESLRRELGNLAPKSLKFAPGPLPEAPARRRDQRVEATLEEREEAARIAARIDDPELREQVARAAAASLARARSGGGDDRRL
jgi:hypothetical protein